MNNRRDFLVKSSLVTAGLLISPKIMSQSGKKVKNIGVQLYTFRDAMMKDPIGTLKKIAALGIKQIETAGSAKGYYYGLEPSEMKNVCDGLGMTLRSGHVRLDKHFQKTIEEAVESGQEYVICSSMPSKGQTISNYKKVADAFNKAGEDCNKMGLKFGYHNHAYEFESHKGEVLYDVLLDNTEASLVHMELDLGWVIVAGKDPLDYFKRYSGRFPLWHLKDMDLVKKHSVELGKGGLDILAMLKNSKESGLKYLFIEQEEYANTPFESMTANMIYLNDLRF